MKNYMLTIAYDGTRYLGWQRLGGKNASKSDRTIQGKLEAVLSKMTGQPVEISGSGRTDAGVHALAQIANFHTVFDTTPDEIRAYLARYLPEDIAVTAVAEAAERFHARLHAKAKVYRYAIHNSSIPDPFRQRFEYRLAEPLDIEKMRAAASYLCGTHDFRSLSSSGRVKKSTVRTLYSVDIEPDGDRVYITFRGDGFLYNMARILTGTLIEAGLGRRRPEDIPALFESARADAGYTAPARGLTLVKVEY